MLYCRPENKRSIHKEVEAAPAITSSQHFDVLSCYYPDRFGVFFCFWITLQFAFAAGLLSKAK